MSFITNDIYEFTLKLIAKYKCNLGNKILSQLDSEDELELKNFLFRMFDILFSIKSEDDLESDEEDNL